MSFHYNKYSVEYVGNLKEKYHLNEFHVTMFSLIASSYSCFLKTFENTKENALDKDVFSKCLDYMVIRTYVLFALDQNVHDCFQIKDINMVENTRSLLNKYITTNNSSIQERFEFDVCLDILLNGGEREQKELLMIFGKNILGLLGVEITEENVNTFISCLVKIKNKMITHFLKEMNVRVKKEEVVFNI